VLLKRFLATERAWASRQKRGGGAELIPLDAERTETRYVAEPADELSSDKAFDRRWAQVLLERETDRLRAQCIAEGKEHLFAELKPFLSGEGEEPYEAVARRLHVPKATLGGAGASLPTALRTALARGNSPYRLLARGG
jgi:hypothetical protein